MLNCSTLALQAGIFNAPEGPPNNRGFLDLAKVRYNGYWLYRSGWDEKEF